MSNAKRKPSAAKKKPELTTTRATNKTGVVWVSEPKTLRAAMETNAKLAEQNLALGQQVEELKRQVDDLDYALRRVRLTGNAAKVAELEEKLQQAVAERDAHHDEVVRGMQDAAHERDRTLLKLRQMLADAEGRADRPTGEALAEAYGLLSVLAARAATMAGEQP